MTNDKKTYDPHQIIEWEETWVHDNYNTFVNVLVEIENNKLNETIEHRFSTKVNESLDHPVINWNAQFVIDHTNVFIDALIKFEDAKYDHITEHRITVKK